MNNITSTVGTTNSGSATSNQKSNFTTSKQIKAAIVSVLMWLSVVVEGLV
ncbi:MAG: hypothetical protein ACXV8Q_13875 [Methylobacter sp.]